MMKSEKGQALPLAILALTVGTLLVAPFLGHASSSVIGSRIYNDAIAYRNACDAGVEHAIWKLVYGSLGASIPNVGDQTSYQLPESINGITPTITVTTNASGGTGGTTGSITKTVIDTLDFDTGGGYETHLIKITNNICAIAYRGASNKGYLVTLSVSSSGDIGNTVISTLAFDTSQCYEPCIVHVTGNIYAIAYRAASNRGYLKTVSIDTSGIISAVIDTLTYDSTACYTPSMVQVNTTIYAIAYRGSTNRGYLKTASIDATGAIGNSVISTLNFDTTACYEPSITQVTSTIYAIAYRGSSNYGYVKTASITSGGTIGGSAISTLIFDTSGCWEPCIIQVSSTIYAIAYRGTSSSRGYLKTVSITSGGTIGGSAISTFIFDTATCYTPDIIQVATNVYAIVYRNSTYLGYLKTVTIASNGTITQTAIDTFNFETSSCTTPWIINTYNNIFAVAYLGPNTDGYLKTIGISNSTGTGINVYSILSAAGTTSIQAYVNITIATSAASIVSWKIS